MPATLRVHDAPSTCMARMARQTAVTGGGARTTSQQAGVVSPRSPRRATSFCLPARGRPPTSWDATMTQVVRRRPRSSGQGSGWRATTSAVGHYVNDPCAPPSNYRACPGRPAPPAVLRSGYLISCRSSTHRRYRFRSSRERAMREHALARRCWIRVRSRRRTLTNAAAKQMREPLVLSPLAIPDLLTPPLNRVCKLGGSPVRAPHAPSPKHDRVDSSGRKPTLNPHG